MFEQTDAKSNNQQINGTTRDQVGTTPARLAQSPRVLLHAAHEISQQLHALPAQADLEQAWCEYDAIASRVKAADKRQLGDLENALEEHTQDPTIPSKRLQASVLLLSERVGDDIRDAWARLRARDLVEILKSDGASLRTIHEDVGVSTPYLSQLANGTGPVPSEKILDRLVGGVRRRGLSSRLPVDHASTPPQWIEENIDRGRVVRKHLMQLTEHRSPPVVHIEGLSPRQQHRLEPIFANLAERCLDLDSQGVTGQLLRELVEGDEALHDILHEVAQNDTLVEIVSHVIRLDSKGRQGLLALLTSRSSQVTSPTPSPPRAPKQPLDEE